jgi:SAM-dependent methyltransferase
MQTSTAEHFVAQSGSAAGSCLLCGGRKIHYCFSIEKYRVEQCANCGLMRLNPQPTDQELSDRVAASHRIGDYSELHRHAGELRAASADHYLDLLAAYVGAPLTGRLLKIGSDLQEFVTRAAARGLSVKGIEYPIVAQRDRHGNLTPDEFTNFLVSGERFDFVVFADVLEHVRDPRLFLRQMHALLRDDGVAVAIVPTLGSRPERFMKDKWRGFKPENLWYYSQNTLRRLLHSEGFGGLRMEFARKALSIDYAAKYFERHPSQPYALAVRLLQRLLPRFLRRRPIHMRASDVIAFARREEYRPRKTLSIVMPAFNEEKTIRGGIDRVLSKRIEGVDLEVIIVESNSTDRTREIVREYEGRSGVKVVWEERPRGKGHAVRTGFAHVTGDYVLIQDADDEYDIEDYDALIEPLMTGEAAFVLGARHGGGAWKLRKFEDQRLAGHVLNFGHWVFATLVNVVYGLNLKDPFTMYKVFRADCLRGLKFECNRFDFDYELLIKLVRRGYRPIEIPVNYRSRSFKEGKKVNAFRDPWTWLRAIAKFRFQKM